MKKILALVVAFALCFTAVAGCFTATAEDAVPTITIKDATAADGAIVIPVEGTNLQSVDSYLITIVLPADYTDIAVEGMEPAGDNGGDYAVKGTSVKILNEIEKLDTDNDGAIAFNVTAKVPAVEADRVDDVTATVDAGNADAQPVDVTVVPGKATLKAPVVEPPVTEPVLDSNIAFGHSLNLASDLSITFRVKISLMEGYDANSIYAKIYRDLYTFGENPVKSESEVVTVPAVVNGDRYTFKYSGMAAREMASNVYCVVYGTKDGVEYCSVQDVYSIGAWCLAASKGNKAKDQKLAATLAHYGAQAQLYTKYRTDALVNGGEMAAYMERKTTADMSAYTDNKESVANPSGVDAITRSWGRSVMLTDILGLNFKAYLTQEYLDRYDELTAKVSYTSVDTGLVELDEVLVSETATRCAYTYYGLKSYEFNVPVTVTVFDGENQITNGFKTSVLDWCVAAYNNTSNENEKNLAAAIVSYNVGAKEYFGK